MNNVQADMPQEDEETTVYTIRGIRKSLDETITDLATYYGKPKATLIREFIEKYFSDHVRNFELHSPLVSTFDAEIADYIKADILDDRYSNFHTTRTNHVFLKLLGIDSEEQLRTLLLNNAPYLRMRADQVCAGMVRIPRGLSLTFAMFAELARRDGATILEAHDTIFNHFKLEETSERFYRHINQIRAEMKRPPVLPDTAISESGEKVIVTVYSPQDYAAEAWKVHLRLRDGVRSPKSGFAFPVLEKRLFIPDQPYRKVMISDSGEWDMGFVFLEGVCELHLYSNGIPEEENPVPLKKVVSELISSIESHL
ncbi:hypothetical protein [Citrobacter braakii]|uniref:hypothetical protein n=1 Tax=Citrobacter braakii TaxID=57706 RepID=UPI002DB97884|nr:hypothetical protein [Citrobacter braakii]MEB8160721.1 hypothetical protein [Citrobacter braakii]